MSEWITLHTRHVYEMRLHIRVLYSNTVGFFFFPSLDQCFEMNKNCLFAFITTISMSVFYSFFVSIFISVSTHTFVNIVGIFMAMSKPETQFV